MAGGHFIVKKISREKEIKHRLRGRFFVERGDMISRGDIRKFFGASENELDDVDLNASIPCFSSSSQLIAANELNMLQQKQKGENKQ